MKKIMISLIAGIVCFYLTITPAHAGSKQQHRWEGVAIGVGAAILGHAILNHHPPADRGKSCYYPPSPPRHRDYPHHKKCREHWETKKFWIDPIYEKVWNPGHYNRHHKWVPGEWIRIVREPGHWVEEKIRVGCR